MYAFANRADTSVVDEPLYAHYLTRQRTEAKHPARNLILGSMENNGQVVVHRMLKEEYGREAVVFKQMTHHLVDLDRSFLFNMQNVLLIRNPRDILRSFTKVITDISAEDIGIPQQYALFRGLKAAGKLDAVVDAKLLLQQPRKVLGQLCERLALPFNESMLSWPAGPRPEDGVWAPHWYSNVHRSTGFQAYEPKTFTLPPHLEELALACLPAYDSMVNEALR